MLQELQEQGRIASVLNDLMFSPEDVGGMDDSWKGHAMRHMYLQGVYSAVREKFMRNVSGDVF